MPTVGEDDSVRNAIGTAVVLSLSIQIFYVACLAFGDAALMPPRLP
jgi:hypothetical protein